MKKIEILKNYFIYNSEGGLFEDIMNNVILKSKAEKLKFILINIDVPKYNQYKDSEYAYIPIVTGDIGKVYDTINFLSQELIYRYEEFNKIGVKTIEEFNKKSNLKFTKLIIFIDEIEDIVKYKNYNKIENEFCKLLSRGLNVGIQFLIETKYDMGYTKYGKMMCFLKTAIEKCFKKNVLLIQNNEEND